MLPARMRWPGFILLLLVIAAYLAWLSTPQWLPAATGRMLEQQGLRLDNLEAGRPGLTRWQLEHVQARHPATGAGLTLRNVALHRPLAALLGRPLRRLDIGQLDLAMVIDSQDLQAALTAMGSDQGTTHGDPLQQLAELLHALPLQEARVERMRVRLATGDNDFDAQLALGEGGLHWQRASDRLDTDALTLRMELTRYPPEQVTAPAPQADAGLRVVANDSAQASPSSPWPEDGAALDLMLELSATDLMNPDARRLQARLTDPSGLLLEASLQGTAQALTLQLKQAEVPLASGLLPGLWPQTWPLRSGTLTLQGEIRLHESRDWQGLRLRGLQSAASLELRPDQYRLKLEQTRARELRYQAPGAGSPALEAEQAELTGNLALETTAGSLTGDLTGQLDLSLAALSRGDLSAQRLTGTLDLSGTPSLPRADGTIAAEALQTLVPTSDLQCRLSLQAPALLELGDCSLQALGGSLRLASGHLNWRTGAGYLPLAVDDVELNALLALMRDPALGGSGLLSGSLPVRLQAGAPSIQDGWLAARTPGGTLHYLATPEQLQAARNPQLELVMKALADLRYERLRASVDYAEGGELVLGMDIRGHSPELEDGRPIEMNLKVTQNLLDLLRSLQFDLRDASGVRTPR